MLLTLICVLTAYWWGGPMAAYQTTIVGILEVSFSFDNSVLNAARLKRMDPFYQFLFLTFGMLIAVFGMRAVFPVAIVASASDASFMQVVDMALHNPEQYRAHLEEAHVAISSFGGVFLLLVFLNFLFNGEKTTHWFSFEERLAGELARESVPSLLALVVLLGFQPFLEPAERHASLLAGVIGICLHLAVDLVSGLLEDQEDATKVAQTTKRLLSASAASFLYLEVLDSSMSFDGVIGAFAVSKDIVVIMLGLTIGSMFVRSITVMLVKKGTLDQFIYLEHGAHYAIGALAIIMLLSLKFHIPELFTSLIGAAMIGWSVVSSIQYNRTQVAA